jgi:predicted transport protein
LLFSKEKKEQIVNYFTEIYIISYRIAIEKKNKKRIIKFQKEKNFVVVNGNKKYLILNKNIYQYPNMWIKKNYNNFVACLLALGTMGF